MGRQHGILNEGWIQPSPKEEDVLGGGVLQQQAEAAVDSQVLGEHLERRVCAYPHEGRRQVVVAAGKLPSYSSELLLSLI